jgi:hypothetical protein
VTWGIGPWGLTPWGTGGALPVPALAAIQSFPGPLAENTGPAVVDELGGTVCLALGSGFDVSVTVEILAGPIGTPIVVVDEDGKPVMGYVAQTRYDVTSSRVYFGAPALTRGLYHVRLSTDGGTSSVLENAIAARSFAYDYKIVSARAKLAPQWATGTRELRTG